ncbi:MAG: helix-turn-helix domain-containing protein [Clostridia bacterium]|nr:helix-turn-helix domain-containing protein [Clostridia bacterium]
MESRIVSETYNFAHLLSEVATQSFLIHSHDCYELYYFVSGEMQYLYDGTEYTLEPETLLLIPPGAIHGIRILSAVPYNRYTYHFVPAFFDKERREAITQLLPTISTARSRTSPIPFFIEHADRFHVREKLDEILQTGSHGKEMELLLAPVIMESLIASLYLGLSGGKPSVPHFSPQVPHDLAEILDYIRRHPSDRITLEKLSTRFFVSRSQLNNLFQRYFHTSVMDYVAGQRLSYAQKLLISGMPAQEVASTIGYTDYSTFYRAYSKRMGHPPNQDKSAGETDEMRDGLAWADAIPFEDPTEAMRSGRALRQRTLPDISFENNVYDPLDTLMDAKS